MSIRWGYLVCGGVRWVCVCRVAGGVACGCCVAVPGWWVGGDDVYVGVVGVCWVGRMMWDGVCRVGC